MKLLVITQKIDLEDSVLGFFHYWVEKLSTRFGNVNVICLGKGKYSLPSNVKVFSLGKETLPSRISYVRNFYKYIWLLRNDYDAVFVHMNQEYVILGGLFWRLMGKRVYMWRNHHAGNLLTDLAIFLSNKVFCTSKFSYTANSKKTVLMPVGVDTDMFKPVPGVARLKNSILFLGRISKVKMPHLLLEALGDLRKSAAGFIAKIVGDPAPDEVGYLEELKKYIKEADLESEVSFNKGLPYRDLPALYSASEIFVNLSTSGMYDKTIFEAMACETLVLVSNENLRGLVDDKFIFKYGDKDDFSNKLKNLLDLPDDKKKFYGGELRSVALREHSLASLVDKLSKEIL